MTYIRRYWTQSKPYRIILGIALAYVLLRLIIHGVFLATLVSADGLEGHDLQIYLDASHRLLEGQPLYPQETPDYIEFYQYAPAYALVFVPFLWLPVPVTVTVLSLLHIGAYVLMYVKWQQIFAQLGLERANQVLALTLPVWLVFSQFWTDLGYLNVYVFMALLATLLVKSIMDQKMSLSVLWLAIILQVKPQWAFAAALPLLLGQRRFFTRLVGVSIVTYVAITGVLMLIFGAGYIWKQQVDYATLLLNISQGAYPWRGPDALYLGYNHSIVQITVYLLGARPTSFQVATAIQAILLLPLVLVCLRELIKKDPAPSSRYLDLAFALYLGAFIWLDVVWEVTYGIVLFTYLLSQLGKKGERIWVWAIFMPYALVDLWRLVSVGVWGWDIVAPGPFILTDPAIYIPLVMIVILVFYGLLIRQLWRRPMSSGAD